MDGGGLSDVSLYHITSLSETQLKQTIVVNNMQTKGSFFLVTTLIISTRMSLQYVRAFPVVCISRRLQISAFNFDFLSAVFLICLLEDTDNVQVRMSLCSCSRG